MDDVETFYAHRTQLAAVAYRILGDMAQAEAMLHEAWLRWHRRQVRVDAPREFLVSLVTHLCVDELGARARRAHRDLRAD
jgi:RNA polymerase sigma-70 factor (ECF subfamily)